MSESINSGDIDMYKYFPPYPVIREGQKIIVPTVYNFCRGKSGDQRNIGIE